MFHHQRIEQQTGLNDLLRRPALAMAARQQREHQRPAPPVPAQGDRPQRLDRRPTRQASPPSSTIVPGSASPTGHRTKPCNDGHVSRRHEIRNDRWPSSAAASRTAFRRSSTGRGGTCRRGPWPRPRWSWPSPAPPAVLGPARAGILTPFPVAISVICAFVLAQEGPAAAIILLEGVLRGLTGFAVFCFGVAALLPRLPPVAACGGCARRRPSAGRPWRPESVPAQVGQRPGRVRGRPHPRDCRGVTHWLTGRLD